MYGDTVPGKLRGLGVGGGRGGGGLGEGGWELQPPAINLCCYLRVPSAVCSNSNRPVELSKWSYTGGIHDVQTSKCLEMSLCFLFTNYNRPGFKRYYIE